MLMQRTLKTTFALMIGFAVFVAPAYANPGNGNGNGNGNHGNNGAHGNKEQGYASSKNEHGHRKNARHPDHVQSDISFSQARALAVNYGLVGYESLPPGIAKKVARGKALPPGIAKKNLPASMINALPYYPGYEWRAVGDDLVLIALSTAVVTAVINGVFN